MTETIHDTKPEEAPLVERNEKGQLLPGSKLGTGRRRGSKNKATLYREAMQNRVSIKISKAAGKVVDVVVDQAIKEGCRQSQKMILDRAVPVMKADDGGDSSKDVQIEIKITSLTRDNVDEVTRRGTVIEGEYETE